jgi:hypothetical protein
MKVYARHFWIFDIYGERQAAKPIRIARFNQINKGGIVQGIDWSAL